MPVWLSVTSLRFCAQTVGNPVTAVEAAIAAPPFRIERREILRRATDALSLFISISLEVLTGCLYRQFMSLRARQTRRARCAHNRLRVKMLLDARVEGTSQPVSTAS